MEANRKITNSGPNNRFRRDNQQNPYDRAPQHMGAKRGTGRPFLGQGNNNSNSRPGTNQQQNNRQDPQRIFDDSGREVSGPQRSHQLNLYQRRRPNNQESSGAAAVRLPPQEEKAKGFLQKGFLQTVMNQEGGQRINNSNTRPGPSQQNNGQDLERIFDDGSRKVSVNQRYHQLNLYQRRRPNNAEPSGAAAVQLTPLEEKAKGFLQKGFLQTVMNQEGDQRINNSNTRPRTSLQNNRQDLERIFDDSGYFPGHQRSHLFNEYLHGIPDTEVSGHQRSHQLNYYHRGIPDNEVSGHQRSHQLNYYHRGIPDNEVSGHQRSHQLNDYHRGIPDNEVSGHQRSHQFHDYHRGRPDNVVSGHQRSLPLNPYHRRRPNNAEPSAAAAVRVTPLEEKAKSFLQTVMNQEGVRSKLILLETVKNAWQILQGAVDFVKLQLIVELIATGEYVLKIDKEEIVKGAFPNKSAAKTALAEQAMEILKQDCFFIVKKKAYVELSTKIKNVQQGRGTGEVNKYEPSEEPRSSFQGSKAVQMMLNMGWGGKGLGVNEQGGEKILDIDQNLSRQGLGTEDTSRDAFKKIRTLLEDFSQSDKITLLKLDPNLTSEERVHIHKIASQFGLKAKSEGMGKRKRMTLTKKLDRDDLVYNLLISGLENALYKLTIPPKFEHLWNADSEYYNSYHPHFSY